MTTVLRTNVYIPFCRGESEIVSSRAGKCWCRYCLVEENEEEDNKSEASMGAEKDVREDSVEGPLLFDDLRGWC